MVDPGLTRNTDHCAAMKVPTNRGRPLFYPDDSTVVELTIYRKENVYEPEPIRISRAAARHHSADMTGKNIVITGSTAGMGHDTGGKYIYYSLFRKGIYEKPGTDLVNDEALQERLWKISEELIGEEFNVG